ncbi:MAG: hypothetical protein GC168_04440 [Candidatus Hydrogenedens sp.]|nr:hypothetical protein [Candidatus Hydrogenedens sp.]
MLAIFRDWRFWLNYLFSLLLTVWIPMARLEFRFEETNEVVKTTVLPMYQIYIDFVQHPGTPQYYKYIALHLGGVFAITAVVWFLMQRRAKPGAESADEA